MVLFYLLIIRMPNKPEDTGGQSREDKNPGGRKSRLRTETEKGKERARKELGRSRMSNQA